MKPSKLVACIALMMAVVPMPFAHADDGAFLTAKIDVRSFKIKWLQYYWSVNTDVDPFTMHVAAESSATVLVTVNAARSLGSSINSDARDLGGAANLCFTNDGDQTTQDLRVMAGIEVFVPGPKQEGQWHGLDKTIQAVAFPELRPGTTACKTFEFVLPRHARGDKSYRVAAWVHYGNGLGSQRTLTNIVAKFFSEQFKYVQAPTVVIELDETAQVGIQAGFPSGFSGGGQISLGTINGSTVLTHNLVVHNINRCGTEPIIWDLETILFLPDSKKTMGSQMSPQLTVDPCAAPISAQ